MNPAAANQTTACVYGVTHGRRQRRSTRNDLLAAATSTRTRPPGQPQQRPSRTRTTVNALGQVVTATDRNGTVHTYTYDVLGRLTSDAVTTLGAGVDGAVRRIDTAYDSQGNAYLVTSYDAATGGSVVNQVQRPVQRAGPADGRVPVAGGAV